LANLNESEMALFPECTAQCSSKELDTADIVRDGDFSPTTAGVQNQGGAGRKMASPGTVRGRIVRDIADLSGTRFHDLPQTREEVESIGKIVQCTAQYSSKELDTADIVRDSDFTTVIPVNALLVG
jgi:hypothetical protein